MADNNPFDTEERKHSREAFGRFVDTEVTPYADDWDEAGEVPLALHDVVKDFDTQS